MAATGAVAAIVSAHRLLAALRFGCPVRTQAAIAPVEIAQAVGGGTAHHECLWEVVVARRIGVVVAWAHQHHAARVACSSLEN